VQYVKDQCIGVALELTKELARCFPAHDFMNVVGIIYPQYWEASNAEATFAKHLTILKVKFYHPKSKGPNGI
jgi:hypothetical protein